jgi:hypothetical protein
MLAALRYLFYGCTRAPGDKSKLKGTRTPRLVCEKFTLDDFCILQVD